MQEIIKDQNRYSGMPDYIVVGDQQVLNTAKIRDGIRRFRKGMRNREGKKDRAQMEQLRFNLHKESEQNWETALDAACRWEAAHDLETSESGSNESSDSDDEVEAAEYVKMAKKKCKKGKKRSKGVPVDMVADAEDSIATLVDKVETNRRDIMDIKGEQEKLSACVKAWKDETSVTLNEILQAIKQPQQQQHAPGISDGVPSPCRLLPN